MDVALIFTLFACIFALPGGVLLALNPRLRKLGAGIAVIGAIGLAVTGVMVWHLYR